MPAPLMTNADPIWLPQEVLPLFSLAVERTVKSLEVPMAMLSIVTNTAEASGSNARDGISIVAETGFGKPNRQQRRGYLTLIRHAIDRRTTLHLDNLESEPKIFGAQAFYEVGGRSAIVTPIFSSSDTCLGAIVAVSKAVKGFAERDIYCLQTIADWLGSEFDRHVLLQAQIAQWGKYWESRDLKDTESLDLSAIENELISHLTRELRTPLTCILGMSSILQKHIHGSLSDKQESYLKIIHNSGKQLLKTVEEIDNLNTLLGDKSTTETEPIDLELLSIQVIKKLESLGLEKGCKIELFFQLDRNIWLLNRSQINIILYYLLSNAIEASTVKNCTTITIYNALSKEDNRERLTIDIKNSSLSPNFDKFQDRYQQMTLCLCAKLAARHQGKLLELSVNPYCYQLILPTNFDMGNSLLN